MILTYKLKKWIVGVFILLFILVSGNVVAQQQEDISQYPIEKLETLDTKSLQEAQIVRVVDGDTLVVLLSGKEQKVRLIGIDTPESVHPDKSRNTEKGIQASNYTKKLLPVGTVVWLERDVSDEDRYGRLLRYVWLVNPNDLNNVEEVKTQMLNARLVSEGFATAKEYAPDTRWSELFSILE